VSIGDRSAINNLKHERSPRRGTRVHFFEALIVPRFHLFRCGGIEQETDEVGLPIGSGPLEYARELGFSRRVGNAAPPPCGHGNSKCRRRDPSPRRSGRTGGADLSRASGGRTRGSFPVTTATEAPRGDPRNIREPGFGSKRRHPHLEGRSAEIARDREFAAGSAKRGRGSRA
jgi:hypothetical protein